MELRQVCLSHFCKEKPICQAVMINISRQKSHVEFHMAAYSVPHLDVELWVLVEVIKEFLVVVELNVPLA